MHLMPTLTPQEAETIVAGWRGGHRSGDGWESPAGPLFAIGDHAEADITLSGGIWLGTCGTNCSSPSCAMDSKLILMCC